MDLLSWSGGRLSDGALRAIYHEARRRGLTQSEIADLVGLSRSHFANLLSGRFGASAESAARIRDFLIAAALTVGGSP
jgi:transcriptional regulator with XRE-family HTH domain